MILQFEDQQTPFGANPRVNDSQVHRSFRKIMVSRVNRKGRLNNILTVDLVGYIYDGGRGIDGQYNPFHQPHILIVCTEIR